MIRIIIILMILVFCECKECEYDPCAKYRDQYNDCCKYSGLASYDCYDIWCK
jgi:hypothetical protein